MTKEEKFIKELEKRIPHIKVELHRIDGYDYEFVIVDQITGYTLSRRMPTDYIDGSGTIEYIADSSFKTLMMKRGEKYSKEYVSPTTKVNDYDYMYDNGRIIGRKEKVKIEESKASKEDDKLIYDKNEKFGIF